MLGPFVYDPRQAPAARPVLALAIAGANPFRGEAGLTWTLPGSGDSSLRIHAVNGRVVRTLFSGARNAGEGATVWDGRDDAGRSLPAGIYRARIECGSERRNVRLVLVDKVLCPPTSD